MCHFLTWPILLAEREDSGIVWGRFDHQRPGFGSAEWAVIVGASCLVLVVMIVTHWRAKRKRKSFSTTARHRCSTN